MSPWSQVVTRVMLLLMTPALSTVPHPTPDITDQAFIKEYVTEHNQHRSRTDPPASNMRYMSWDEGLAITARDWSRKCLFEHNNYLQEPGRAHPVFSPVGENLWAGTSFSVKGAIDSWVNEVKDYNYDTNSCREKQICGHYTQVVWADSYKVGCAIQYCPNGVAETNFYPRPAYIFVCNYATAGNYAGMKPYITGSPCSGCGGEKCDNNLCRNDTRDTQRYWDASECGVFCKVVLIIRPVSLVVILGSVYCIQLHYPNLFAYTS